MPVNSVLDVPFYCTFYSLDKHGLLCGAFFAPAGLLNQKLFLTLADRYIFTKSTFNLKWATAIFRLFRNGPSWPNL